MSSRPALDGAAKEGSHQLVQAGKQTLNVVPWPAAKPFFENIKEPKIIVGSFQEVLLFSTSFLKNFYVTRDDFLF
jgi:hypothetical protein